MINERVSRVVFANLRCGGIHLARGSKAAIAAHTVLKEKSERI